MLLIAIDNISAFCEYDIMTQYTHDTEYSQY